MKKILSLLIAAAALVALPIYAQTVSIVGTPVTISGQTFLIATNSSGGYTLSTSGVNGSATVSSITTPQQAAQAATQMIAANNVTNISFYATNELDFRLGAEYLQNSGQAVASLSATKYGWFNQSELGFGAGVLQGNNGGKSGTAGAWGEIDYRKPIGDVAAEGGLIGGYDNWNKKPFAGVKGGIEYRQNAHLGEFVEAAYAFETGGVDRGLLVATGITYCF